MVDVVLALAVPLDVELDDDAPLLEDAPPAPLVLEELRLSWLVPVVWLVVLGCDDVRVLAPPDPPIPPNPPAPPGFQPSRPIKS